MMVPQQREIGDSLQVEEIGAGQHEEVGQHLVAVPVDDQVGETVKDVEGAAAALLDDAVNLQQERLEPLFGTESVDMGVRSFRYQRLMTGESKVDDRLGGPQGVFVIGLDDGEVVLDGIHLPDDVVARQDAPENLIESGESGIFELDMKLVSYPGQEATVTSSVIDLDQTIDWASQKDGLQPEFLSDSAWDQVFSSFWDAVGNTGESLVEPLVENAFFLSDFGVNSSNASTALAYELEQAGDLGSLAERTAEVVRRMGGAGSPLTRRDVLRLEVFRILCGSEASAGAFNPYVDVPWRAIKMADMLMNHPDARQDGCRCGELEDPECEVCPSDEEDGE